MSDKFVVEDRTVYRETITRTIRMPIELSDLMDKLAKENDITFNNVANQMLKYAAENLEK